MLQHHTVNVGIQFIIRRIMKLHYGSLQYGNTDSARHYCTLLIAIKFTCNPWYRLNAWKLAEQRAGTECGTHPSLVPRPCFIKVTGGGGGGGGGNRAWYTARVEARMRYFVPEYLG